MSAQVPTDAPPTSAAAAAAPAPPRSYLISCHCQAHVLRLTPPGPLVDHGVCDCSHCIKRRLIWNTTPPGTLEVVRGCGWEGGAEMSEYRMGSKSSAHQFCGTCGTHLLGSKFDPTQEMYYNMRAIRDAELDIMALPLNLYSGIDRKPAYTYTTLADVPGAEAYLSERASKLDYPTTILAGSCHCQAVKFGLLCKPLENVILCDCACSICLGNGVLWIYPERHDIYFHPPASPSTPWLAAPGVLREYAFHTRKNIHYFCATCGINVLEHTAPEEKAEREGSNQVDPNDNGWDGCGVNVALLSGIGGYLGDFHGLGEEAVRKRMEEDGEKAKSEGDGAEGGEGQGVEGEGKGNGLGFARLRGIRKEPEMKFEEPVYAVKV